MSSEDSIPPGFKLRCTLRGNRGVITKIAWSPNKPILASGSNDHIIRLWDTQAGELLQTFEGHTRVATSVAWAPDGQTLASASDDETIRLWDVKSGELLRTLTDHTGRVLSVVWSPDGQTLASASFDQTVCLWDADRGEVLHSLIGHVGRVLSVAWAPDGQTLASASDDMTIRLWSSSTGQQTSVLENHTDCVLCISFSSDGYLLASKSLDNTIRLWRCDTWEMMTLPPELSNWPYSSLAFHPTAPSLATLGEGDRVIHIWDWDIKALLTQTPSTHSIHYRNAKVVLVGDTGVGKSGLRLVLTGQAFSPTESSHGRYVSTFDYQEVDLGDGYEETRETFLWDLAGQPGYRLIHQLHLNEVAVALVVFDARSETDPFAGVRHWAYALRQAQRLQGDSALPMKKFLISARTDRGGPSVSSARLDSLIHELGFDGYYAASAKEGRNIAELANAIRGAINWKVIPKMSSSELFYNIKAFLLAEKKTGRVLCIVDELYHTFLKSKNAFLKSNELRALFDTCIHHVESRDLIRRLSFGNLILLQPELLDAYASAIVIAAKEEPDGMGCIAEEDVREGLFPMPEDERIKDREQERLLLIATIESLLYHEIALREQGQNGSYLVFPSQFTRENSALSEPEGKAVTFGFEGPLLNIYATLAVRLSHSGVFKAREMWKNAALYTALVSGTCGIFLRVVKEGSGELTLFFDEAASEEVRFQFEEFVHAHLLRRALRESIYRRRIFVCPECSTPVTELQANRRRERGFDWIECNVCTERVSLLDREERLAVVLPSRRAEMDRMADAQRDLERAASILQGKISIGVFDVFLCYDSRDKIPVKKIGEQLKARGIYPWMDEWEMQPGRPWQDLLQEQIAQIKSAAVFVGREGIDPWQHQDLAAFLQAFADRGYPIILVFLSNATIHQPILPAFLENTLRVDFRNRDPDPLDRLIWSILGRRDQN